MRVRIPPLLPHKNIEFMKIKLSPLFYFYVTSGHALEPIDIISQIKNM